MRELNEFRLADLWLGFVDMQSVHKTSIFTEKAASTLTSLRARDIFLLARKYINPIRPQATRLLCVAVAVELFFLDTAEIADLLIEGRNSEIMERLFLSEITQRGEAAGDLLHLTLSIKEQGGRWMFLHWLTDQSNLTLANLLLLRRNILATEFRRNEKVIKRELDIVDESIKTALITSTEERLMLVLTSIKNGVVKKDELPNFFLPLVSHLFPYLSV